MTNHHCGYSSIQGLSTDEHNYLMDGYWAKNLKEEIPCPGLSVTFLVSMEDVTDVIEKGGDAKALEKDAEAANPGCEARVTGFYNDNVHYLIITRTYEDVRFVGAPPASMGKFGGETDNWMWPRHTCDFSMFRVYAGKDNMPAEYSPENVPYKPARSLKVSLKGVQEGDYAMVMGYPGRTQRYQTAEQLKQMIAVNRIRIDARTVLQDLMWEAMCADPSVQLKYADKYAGSANGWKKWQGEELAFGNLNIIGREEQKEADLKAWIEADPDRAKKYGAALIAGKSRKESFKRAQELLDFLKLSDRVGHKPAQLSGGEQQRVSVARALMNNPDLILADEPSGNLDTENARKLHDLFFVLRDTFKQTFIIVTHNEELAQLSDRKIVLQDGIVQV